ncbi:hypothetical protein PR048_015796 [Dryococelus australis]|uniref:DRBM domain-containing protein n=1 Tax=Dryococelus australis TaxID=614101 RepID=A0ABQ9HI42_9NEOP|nr:hypothetical protein PR048_015796 [Dryococelus australis]
MAVPLFYYTSRDNFECINQLGLIWTSIGIAGYGIYLTEMTPRSGRKTVAEHLYKDHQNKYTNTEICLETDSNTISAEKLIEYSEEKIWKTNTQLGLASFSALYVATSNSLWQKSEVNKFIRKEHEALNPYSKSPISQLQEMVARSGIQPNYTITYDGTAFLCIVSVIYNKRAEGKGSTKQIAKTEAAKNLLRTLIVGTSENFATEARHVYLNEENNLKKEEELLCDAVDSMHVREVKAEISKCPGILHLSTKNTEVIPKVESVLQMPSHIPEVNYNPVGKLQEFCVNISLPMPLYTAVPLEINNQGNNFMVTVKVGEVVGEGSGPTKKSAKKAAAEDMLLKLGVFIRREVSESQKKFTSSAPAVVGDVIEAQNYSNSNQEVSNPIGKLQEFCVAKGLPMPNYSEVSETGAPHAKTFIIKCSLRGYLEYGTGLSKKDAKHNAALKMWKIVTNN